MICPLRTIYFQDKTIKETHCVESECAWWYEGNNMCAVKTIAMHLHAIAQNTVLPDSDGIEL